MSLYTGVSKPQNLDFLIDFVQELNSIANNFQYQGVHLRLRIHSVVCDQPAVALLKATKTHSGYSACFKCTTTGKYQANRMTFPKLDDALRTDESFRLRTDPEHHRRDHESPFLLIVDMNMIDTFAQDYMHIVCLGVMKKLLLFWIEGPRFCRLTNVQQELSKRLLTAGKLAEIFTLMRIHCYIINRIRLFI